MMRKTDDICFTKNISVPTVCDRVESNNYYFASCNVFMFWPESGTIACWPSSERDDK